MCVRQRERESRVTGGIKNKRVREKEGGRGDSQQTETDCALFFFYVPLYFVVVSPAFRAAQ